jgi:hypothetical protein
VRLSQYCKRKRKGKGGCMTAKKKTAKITVKKAQPIIELFDASRDWEVQFRVSEWKGNQYLESRQKIYLDFKEYEYDDWITVSDLTELSVWEYNFLVEELNKYYPDFLISKLEGRYL